MFLIVVIGFVYLLGEIITLASRQIRRPAILQSAEPAKFARRLDGRSKSVGDDHRRSWRAEIAGSYRGPDQAAAKSPMKSAFEIHILHMLPSMLDFGPFLDARNPGGCVKSPVRPESR